MATDAILLFQKFYGIAIAGYYVGCEFVRVYIRATGAYVCMGNKEQGMRLRDCVLLLFPSENVLQFDLFLPFPKKLMQLPVTLLILGTPDSNIH